MYDPEKIDVTDRLKKAREAAGLSWDDMPVLMPFLSKPWYLDIEMHPDEFADNFSLTDQFMLLKHIKTNPEYILSDYSMPSKLCGSPDEFVQAIRDKMHDDNLTAEQVVDIIGWYMDKPLKWPQYIFTYTLDFLMEACKFLQWNWKKCYCLWFNQWANCGGIEMDGRARKLNFYYLPPETHDYFLELLDKNYPEYRDFMPEHLHYVCLDQNQHSQVCDAAKDAARRMWFWQRKRAVVLNILLEALEP